MPMSEQDPMMKNHIATYKLGMSHEGWSESQVLEDELLVGLAVEDKARREAVQNRNDAEKMLREAKEAHDARERAWAIRQEEKRRYTEEQRAWWDTEVHNKHTDSTLNHEQKEQEEKVRKREALLDREQAKIEWYEKTMRENHEKDEAGWALEYKTNRANEQNELRANDKMIKAENARQRRADNREIQQQMGTSTSMQAEREAKDAAIKFSLGEKERREKEEKRQQDVDTKTKSKSVDYEHATTAFVRDEAARYGQKAAKAEKKKLRLQQGKDRFKALEEERLAEERAAKKKSDMEKRKFHQQTRVKQADKLLDDEKMKHKREEIAAADMVREAERMKLEVKHTNEREKQAAAEFAQIRFDPTGKGAGAMTKPRTAYEAKMRNMYGSGAGTRAVGGVDNTLEFDNDLDVI